MDFWAKVICNRTESAPEFIATRINAHVAVLIEKLLYSLPDLGDVYCLIRTQNGRDSRSRLDAVLESPIFDRLRQAHPERLQKLVRERRHFHDGYTRFICRYLSVAI